MRRAVALDGGYLDLRCGPRRLLSFAFRLVMGLLGMATFLRRRISR